MSIAMRWPNTIKQNSHELYQAIRDALLAILESLYSSPWLLQERTQQVPVLPARIDEAKDLCDRNCDLYDLVVDMNWHQAVHFCRTNPATASHREGDSLETPLHAALQLAPPVTVIRQLLAAYPDALYVPARNGDFPLHMACRYNASIDILRELVKEHPDIARQETRWGNMPLVALWRGRDEGETNEYTSTFYQKIHVILEAVARSRQKESSDCQTGDARDKLYVLHAAVSLGALGCPKGVLDYCLQEYPDQVRETDESGRLPLHLATGPSLWSYGSRHRRYKPREQETVKLLLLCYPESAQCLDPTTTPSRLPLHTALANRHEWESGVCYLVESAPNVLLEPDPTSGLLPFLASAVAVGDTTIDLNTIYQTLRYLPAALQATCPLRRAACGN